MTETTHPYTLHQATHPTQDVSLPCGQTVTLHRLRNGDLDAVLEQYAHFLEALSIVLNTDPTQDEVRQYLPEVLRDTFRTRLPAPEGADAAQATAIAEIGQQAVLGFLNAFCAPEVTVEQVAAWDIDDYTAIWEALWQLCRIPFARGHMELASHDSTGTTGFALARATWALLTNPSTSPSSSAPASTPATPPSTSSTASQSRRGRRNTNSGTRHDKATTAGSGT